MAWKSRFLPKTVLIVALLLAAGCSKLDLLNATIPYYGYRAQYDVAYGEKARQTLDIYLPEKAAEKLRPVVVFFYGGAWQRGNKDDYRFVGESFAKQGYVTVVANYRLYPEVSFPAFVEDSALAVKYIREHVAQFGGDAENLFVAGHSAGAYNAVMLAVEPRYLAAVGGDSSWVRGAIGLSGPYNFLPLKGTPRVEHIPDIFKTAPLEETQPVLCIKDDSGEIPPVFLASGADDDIVVPANTEALAKRLAERGVNVESHIYKGLNHADVAKLLASSFHDRATVLSDIDGFIKRTKR